MPDENEQSTPGLPTKGQQSDYGELIAKDAFIEAITIFGDEAQTAGNYGYIFTARVPLEIIGVAEIHETASSAAGTLQVYKVATATAIAYGVALLATAFNLQSTANVAVLKQGKDLSVVRGSRFVKTGESIGIKTTGTLADLIGVCVTVYFKIAHKGNYK